MADLQKLSRRERQIMEVLYEHGQATVLEVQSDLPDPPTPAAVRTMLGILEKKEKVTRTKGNKGREMLYAPRQPRHTAGRQALKQVLETFFEGDLENALAAHLGGRSAKIDEKSLARMAKLIEEARKKRRS